MVFNSYIYVFAFLPIVFIGYQLLRTTRFANVWMVIASSVFYGWITAWYLIPLIVTSVLDYLVGWKLDQMEDQKRRKLLLVISLTANLGLLSIFKYTGWVSSELASLVGIFGVSMATVSLPLPPGISFYTFQTMSYTIDIYKKEMKPRQNLVSYLAFVTFFPHLVAGPILRARDLLPQIESIRPIVSAKVAAGALFLILFGLFQKTVLADNFGGFVNFIADSMSGPEKSLPAGLGLVFVYAFALQIYCDFAGYSTIARGSARLFGVDLHRNFLTPYFSSNPSEFWTRWHISLSQWLRDYLYVGLGGSRHGIFKTLRNLMITMILGGLWHGAGIFFIIWGFYHGLLLVFYRLVPIDQWLIGRLGRTGKVISTILFFHLVCIGWIFFRATPEQFWPIVHSITAIPGAFVDFLSSYAIYWKLVFEGNGNTLLTLTGTIVGFLYYNNTVSVMSWGLIIFGVPLLITDWLGYRRNCEFGDLWDTMPIVIKPVVICILLYGIIFFARRQANEFIYFAF